MPAKYRPMDTRGKIKLALFILLIVAIVWLFVELPVQTILEQALAKGHELGAWGPILFVLLYVVACILLVPGSLLTLGAGFVFNVVAGTIYVSIGATLGAT